ncbi:hypothetical protein ACFV2X_47980 [Streptomyces sp. NPDC059679]|uniref:hypothetical protein n=1 Tax=Streptomyces sp. NPDC059679 TaxID=3346903 RepID=UPI0036AD7C20
MTKRSTEQQRARELQRAEGIGYHEALNRVREDQRPVNPNITLTDSTLIVIEPADVNDSCGACYRSMAADGQWAVHLADVSPARSGFKLCTACARAIGNAVAHVPATPAPVSVLDDPFNVRVPGVPDQIVAYRSQYHLLCRRHIPKEPISDDYNPVTSEDLENGGNCTVCGIDVLID